VSGRPVKTFSIGFQERDFNELPFARKVAERYGTDHHELVVRPNALEVLPTLVRHYGEPFADSSAVPSYYVAKLTRAHVTVALNGDGGDESFAGYDRYLGSAWAERYRRIPALLQKGITGVAAALIPESLPRRSRLAQAKRLLQVAGMPFARRYLRWVSYFRGEARHDMYTPEWAKQLDGRDGGDWLLGQFDAVGRPGMDLIDTLLAVDVRSYLPYDLLVKMDIATMANSLEARSPFLDHKVMEYAASLPSRYKVRRASLKYLLKQVGLRLLPPGNVTRRKMGFGVPVGQWMRGELLPLVQDLLLSPQARVTTYFRPEAVRRLVDDHRDGSKDYSYQLWAVLWLELWHREFLG
jgi:asparagine synthase (glutamine-hydrolysing)